MAMRSGWKISTLAKTSFQRVRGAGKNNWWKGGREERRDAKKGGHLPEISPLQQCCVSVAPSEFCFRAWDPERKGEWIHVCEEYRKEGKRCIQVLFFHSQEIENLVIKFQKNWLRILKKIAQCFMVFFWRRISAKKKISHIFSRPVSLSMHIWYFLRYLFCKH